jgi:hypothetical protein
VQQISENGAASNPSSSVAPLPVENGSEFVFLPHSHRLEEFKATSAWQEASSEEDNVVLDELDRWGFFLQASSVELVDHSDGPALRVRYGYGVMQFLLSSVREWLPPR